MAEWRPFWILLVLNLSWVIIVSDLSSCFIFMVQLFCICNYSNSKCPLNGHFFNFCSQKGIRSLADIAEHIYLIERRSDGNCFMKRANDHFFVSGHSN